MSSIEMDIKCVNVQVMGDRMFENIALWEKCTLHLSKEREKLTIKFTSKRKIYIWWVLTNYMLHVQYIETLFIFLWNKKELGEIDLVYDDCEKFHECNKTISILFTQKNFDNEIRVYFENNDGKFIV